MHDMVEISSVGDEHLFHCPTPGCGRQVRFERATLQLTVLEPGDVFARHNGSTAPEIFRLNIA